MSDLINGLRHTQDDHECCRGTIQMAIDRIAELECELAEAEAEIKRLRDGIEYAISELIADHTRRTIYKVVAYLQALKGGGE